MIYCDMCADRFGWSKAIQLRGVNGRCDRCGKICYCYDDPSRRTSSLLSDDADALVRRLHKEGMTGMRHEFDGAVLTVWPIDGSSPFKQALEEIGELPCTGSKDDERCCECGPCIALQALAGLTHSAGAK